MHNLSSISLFTPKKRKEREIYLIPISPHDDRRLHHGNKQQCYSNATPQAQQLQIENERAND